MKIGIEAERANTDHLTGVEHYAKQVILNLAKIDSKNQYVLYLRTEPREWLKNLPTNFHLKVISFPVLWTQIRISWEMLTNPVDRLFIMASALPLIHPKNSVVTIHDLAWIYFPETFSAFQRFYLPLSTWYAVRFAKKIIAVSEQTKKDLVKHYKISPDKVTVVYHGFDISTEEVINDPEEEKRIAALPEKFILYQGTLQPRKNIIGLIDAFLELKKERNIPHSLVIVGGKGWLYEKIMEKIQNHPEVQYFGYAKNRLPIIAKSEIMVQPAFYEGFGMGVLDGFAMHKPVAASNVSSLPEVGGDAAEYFDPKDRDSIKEALYKIISNPTYAWGLVQKGDDRIKMFTWEKCAKQTLEVIEHV